MTAPDYAARMAVVREQAAKVAKANHPRNQTVNLPPLNAKVVPFHAYQGIRA